MEEKLFCGGNSEPAQVSNCDFHKQWVKLGRDTIVKLNKDLIAVNYEGDIQELLRPLFLDNSLFVVAV
jgi:hypothetical protein